MEWENTILHYKEEQGIKIPLQNVRIGIRPPKSESVNIYQEEFKGGLYQRRKMEIPTRSGVGNSF